MAAALAVAAVVGAGCRTPSTSTLQKCRRSPNSIGQARSAAAIGWDSELITLPKERMPPHLVPPGHSAQHVGSGFARIRRELGYKEPVLLDEAIHRRTIDWARARPPGEFSPHKFDYAAEDSAAAARATAVSPRPP